jgi:hypothetical protein
MALTGEKKDPRAWDGLTPPLAEWLLDAIAVCLNHFAVLLSLCMTALEPPCSFQGFTVLIRGSLWALAE